ncbi:hypothetical protein ncot_13900 [Nocardioides sp. JQ2195]|uniref:hypothetical protein n=1 Tax=Nocardioides sp. JQ2195 TaxID=2592334 RepID=UPI00143E8572|nr:hypothetical protein [Nocardioides sp. JQ2195]QIX27574.1 hypothetical protein ncot_13900 [Nocardioides sp. JQ2195]
MNLSRLAAGLLLGFLAAGCVPSTPTPSDWTGQASRALDSVAGEVATARIVLREHRQDDLLGKAAVVMLVDAEESLGKTSDDLASTQAPRGRARQYDKVTSEIDEASSLVTEARAAAVANDDTSFPDLEAKLRREEKDLKDLAGALR